VLPFPFSPLTYVQAWGQLRSGVGAGSSCEVHHIMSDQLRWFKVWTSAATDPDLRALGLQDFARWVLFGLYVREHGERGRIVLRSPGLELVQRLKTRTRTPLQSRWLSLIKTLQKFPNVTVDPLDGAGDAVTVTIRNWAKYQEDTSWKRQREYRERRNADRHADRHADRNADSNESDARTRGDGSTPSLKVSPVTAQGKPLASPWPEHPTHLDRKLAAFEEGYATAFIGCPDALAFRAEIVRAAPTWPGRHLPPKTTLLWFRDGDWHPGPA